MKKYLVGLVLVYLALGVVYSVVTPLFEAGDEIWHYPFVQYLAAGNGLPVQDPAQKQLWAQEGGQPPLYYAVSALAMFWIDTRDLRERLWYNPHAKVGIPLAFGNKNLIVHTSAEDFPWRGTTLAVHLIRLLSLLFGASTVVLTYLIAREIILFSPAPPLPRSLALFAAAFVAFNPMFLFISASVNNDNLAIPLASLALLQMIQLITRGATTRRFVFLGIVLGLAALTKVSDLGLLILAAIVFACLLWRSLSLPLSRAPMPPRSPAPPRIIRDSLLCALLVLLIAGWWYARNYVLYGDPLAFNVWLQIAGGRPAPATLWTLLDEFQGFRISFWGNFGGVNIIAPDWVYRVLDAFVVVAAIGLGVGILPSVRNRRLMQVEIGSSRLGLGRQINSTALWLPALWLAIMMVSLIRWTLLTLASQGRLIFPAISAVAVLMAFGLAQLTIRNSKFVIRNSASVIPCAFLFGFALLAPFALIAPAYAQPQKLAASAEVPNPVHIVYEDRAELVGYALEQTRVAPGEELPLTLYWRAVQPMSEDFSVYIHLFDAQGNAVGQWDAYPGNGLYPTRLWQTNEIVVDRYRVPVSLDARGPGVARVEVGLYRKSTLQNLVARDPQGRVITPTIARFKTTGASSVVVQNPVEFKFGDEIELRGYALTREGENLRVQLFWCALKTPREDYTVFAHLVDAQGKLVAQQDNEPQRGAYPTSFWDTGEMVGDEYVLPTPRGEEHLEVGLYRARAGTRLSASGAGDARTRAVNDYVRIENPAVVAP